MQLCAALSGQVDSADTRQEPALYTRREPALWLSSTTTKKRILYIERGLFICASRTGQGRQAVNSREKRKSAEVLHRSCIQLLMKLSPIGCSSKSPRSASSCCSLLLLLSPAAAAAPCCCCCSLLLPEQGASCRVCIQELHLRSRLDESDGVVADHDALDVLRLTVNFFHQHADFGDLCQQRLSELSVGDEALSPVAEGQPHA